MEFPDNIKLDLYLATINYPCSSQYEESLNVLKYIDNVRNKINIIPLNDLVLEDHIFIIMNDLQRVRKLPYLEISHLVAVTFSDYSGQKEIIEYFEDLGLG